MKLVLLLIALIATFQCKDLPEEQDFDFKGVYTISNDCNVLQCPFSYTYGNQFQCPGEGTGNARISEQGGVYKLELRTKSRVSQELGYIAFDFNASQLQNNQVSIDLGNGFAMNLAHCSQGQQTSYLCPFDSDLAEKSIVGWKSFNRQPISGCGFLMFKK